jgi:hypothetical protein
MLTRTRVGLHYIPFCWYSDLFHRWFSPGPWSCLSRLPWRRSVLTPRCVVQQIQAIPGFLSLLSITFRLTHVLLNRVGPFSSIAASWFILVHSYFSRGCQKKEVTFVVCSFFPRPLLSAPSLPRASIYFASARSLSGGLQKWKHTQKGVLHPRLKGEGSPCNRLLLKKHYWEVFNIQHLFYGRSSH